MHTIRRGLVAVAAATTLASAGLMFSSAAGAAVHGRSHAAVHASQVSVQGRLSNPRPSGKSGGSNGTPQGCPEDHRGYLCTYIGEGSGQGASDICLEANTFWKNFADEPAPGGGGKNCHGKDGALVDTHTSGYNSLWSGPNATGQRTCIRGGSYYVDLGNNFYQDGSSLNGNIDSTYWDPGTCVP
jgi:hypothetical protein